MKFSRPTAVIVAAAAAVLAACGPSDAPAAVTVTAQVPVTVTASASTAASSSAPASASASSAAPTASSSAAADAVVPLGTTQTAGPEATVTVYAIDREVPAESYSSDKSPRTAIEVEVCAKTVIAGLSTAPWSLTDDKNARYTPEEYTSDPKLPQYADSSSALTPLAPGECLRGWLMIDVPAGATVTGVRYGLPDQGIILRWSA